MNKPHRDNLARIQVDNLIKLLDAKVRYQTISNSVGSSNQRIVIDYDFDK